MRLKPKILSVVPVLVIVGLMLLSGCANETQDTDNTSNNDRNQSKTTLIATTFYPMYIFTLNIADDIPDVKVVNMTKPTTGCLHDYAVSTEDMKNLEGAEFLIANGAGMESFLDKVLKQFPDLKIIDSSEEIQLIEGDGDEGDNPHVWVSISNAITQVKNIADRLAELDPENAEKYRANTENYVEKLEAQRDKMHEALDGIKNRDVVTFHEAFPYFAKEFNLNIAGVIEREPGSEPSAKELSDTIDKVKQLKIKALFAEPQYPAKAAQAIANESGAKIYVLDPVVTGPDSPDAYVNIMDKNLETLKKALQ